MPLYMISNLQEIRKKKFSSRKKLAQASGVSEKTIERAEKGNVKIDEHSITLIAKALEVEINDIVDMEKSYPDIYK